MAGIEQGGSAAESDIQPGEFVVGVREVASGARTETRNVGLDRVMRIIEMIATDEVELALEPSTGSGMDSGFQQPKIDEKMRNRLRQEYSAPYRQNWILIIIAIVSVLILASYASGIR